MVGADPLAAPLKSAVGDRTAKLLERAFGLQTVGDLLRHYPRRYQERGDLTDLADLALDEEVTVLAEVLRAHRRQFKERRGSAFEVVVTDAASNKLNLTFFNTKNWQDKEFRPGRTGSFSGKVTNFRGTRQMINPEFEWIADDADAEEAAERFSTALIPIYPAVEKMSSPKIQRLIKVMLDTLDDLPDPLPQPVRAEHRLIGLRQALEQVHRPTAVEQAYQARHRLKWDEALPLQVALAQRRRDALELPARPRRAKPGGLLERFDAALPFELTPGQVEVCEQIAQDIAAPHPMHRLLQGEVGSGKTVVALRAMLTVVDTGGQAVLLAPTEVLAQQHHRSIRDLLGPLARAGELDGDPDGTRVCLLTGSQGARERRANLEDARSGAAGIVVGTHAVIEDAVEFADLGLVVIDEQHRFGVEQRDALRAKAADPPHLLVMTATPIPRTVAMTVFGDLETSILRELPRGRSPITTFVVPSLEKPKYLARTWGRIRDEAKAGHQAYVVCPRIGGDAAEEEEDEAAGGDDAQPAEQAPEQAHEQGQLALDYPQPAPARAPSPPKSVVDTAQQLAEHELAGLRIGVLHGRLDPDEKDRVMTAFAAGRVDVLVATTVIEVGVNVPNATVMAVLDADRFGVSQLHQLRGRVGRGSAPGLCLLVTEAFEGTPARERLDAVAATLDGFELSKIDLEQRREGDVLGASQSGRRSSLKMLAVIRDEELIKQARAIATGIVARDPRLAGEPALANAVAALLTADRADYLERS
jgi:ATP-dependent DNA helicase RecG